MVIENWDVFSKELPGQPLTQDIAFMIELDLGIVSISNTSYYTLFGK